MVRRLHQSEAGVPYDQRRRLVDLHDVIDFLPAGAEEFIPKQRSRMLSFLSLERVKEQGLTMADGTNSSAVASLRFLPDWQIIQEGDIRAAANSSSITMSGDFRITADSGVRPLFGRWRSM